MIERPERHIAAFAGAGADVITVHFEATPHVHYTLSSIRDAGCLAGLAICPATPPEAVASAGSAIFGQPDAGEAYRAVLIAAPDG